MNKLCQAFGGAIALTSANVSGGANSLAVEDFRDLWPQCGAVYDGGRIEASPLGSTIIELSSPGTFTVLRPGVAEKATISILEKNELTRKQY